MSALLLPGFRGFLDAFQVSTDAARLATPFAAERVRVGLVRLPGSDSLAYLVDHPAFYDRPGNPNAGPDGSDWPDNHRRFALLGWVAAELARGADPNWRPDLLHGHDWHTGLAPAYLAASVPETAHVPTVFTVHNLAYRGLFPIGVFPELALPPGFFSVYGVEFFGMVSFMKAGLYYADRLTTVSPTYAGEIQTPDFGWGLDGLLRSRAGALTGILNGVDTSIWDPGHDAALPRPYGIEDAMSGKAAAKAALQRRLDLDPLGNEPLFGVVSRLIPQKGLDLVLAGLPALVAGGGQLALLGTGDSDLEHGVTLAAAQYRGRVGAEIGYDESLAHLIIGGSDVILVPSRFEPCGLTQLYALRYGSLPLVKRVGGLADTVVERRRSCQRHRYRVCYRRGNSARADLGGRACHRAISRAGELAAHDGSRNDARLQLGDSGAPLHSDLPRAAPGPPAPGKAGGNRYPPRIVPSATPASVDLIFGIVEFARDIDKPCRADPHHRRQSQATCRSCVCAPRQRSEPRSCARRTNRVSVAGLVQAPGAGLQPRIKS
jgi:starch synthase